MAFLCLGLCFCVLMRLLLLSCVDCAVIHTLSVSHGSIGSVCLNKSGEWLALGCAGRTHTNTGNTSHGPHHILHAYIHGLTPAMSVRYLPPSQPSNVLSHQPRLCESKPISNHPLKLSVSV